MTLAPACVHAQQHLGPVLRLGSAGSGMYGDDRVVAVCFAAEQRLCLKFVYLRLERGDLRLEFGVYLFAFAREVEICGDVFGTTLEFRVAGDRVFKALAFAHDALRTFRVGPEIRVADLLLYFIELGAELGSVKDTPGAREPSLSRR